MITITDNIQTYLNYSDEVMLYSPAGSSIWKQLKSNVFRNKTLKGKLNSERSHDKINIDWLFENVVQSVSDHKHKRGIILSAWVHPGEA